MKSATGMVRGEWQLISSVLLAVHKRVPCTVTGMCSLETRKKDNLVLRESKSYWWYVSCDGPLSMLFRDREEILLSYTNNCTCSDPPQRCCPQICKFVLNPVTEERSRDKTRIGDGGRLTSSSGDTDTSSPGLWFRKLDAGMNWSPRPRNCLVRDSRGQETGAVL